MEGAQSDPAKSRVVLFCKEVISSSIGTLRGAALNQDAESLRLRLRQ
jgi:hypothetical protein